MDARRLCVSRYHVGSRWCLAIDFHVAEWLDIQRTKPKRIQSHCRCCYRMAARIRKGSPPFRHVPKAVQKERQKVWRRRWLDKNREWRRQYDREYSAIRRRMNGVPVRGSRQKEKRIRITKESFRPFWDNLTVWGRNQFRRVPFKSRTSIGLDGEFDVAAFVTYIGLTESEYKTLRRIMNTDHCDSIGFDLCDKILVATGHEYLIHELEVIDG